MSDDEEREAPVSTESGPQVQGAESEQDFDPTAAMAEVILQTRRARTPAIVIGVVSLVVGLAIDELLTAVGICFGLGLGMANARLLRASVQRRFEILVETPGNKTHFLSGGAARLAVLTVITLVAVILVRPLGFGMIVGLAIFQITLLVFAGVSMRKSVRS